MIGVRAGARAGLRVGVAAGVSADQLGDSLSNFPITPGVTLDAAAQKHFPATAGEWTALLAAAGDAAGNPTCLWTCQAATAPVDVIDGANLVDTPVAPLYQQAVAGYSRFGIAFVDGTANQRLLNNSTAPDPSLTSTLELLVVKMPAAAPAAARGLLCKTFTTPRLDLNTTGRIRSIDGASADLVNGICDGGTHLIWHQVNLTASANITYTDAEKFTGVFAAPAGGPAIGYGACNPTTAPSISLLYAARFTGAAAERTTTQLRNLSNYLRWSVPW